MWHEKLRELSSTISTAVLLALASRAVMGMTGEQSVALGMLSVVLLVLAVRCKP